MDEALRLSLEAVFDGRLEKVMGSTRGMGSRYYFRLNSLVEAHADAVEKIRSTGLNISLHETIPEAAHLPIREEELSPMGIEVQADRFAAEAVMQGAHLYAPGVKNCKGLRAGMNATVTDKKTGTAVASGVARQGETAILKYHQGIAVETQQSRFRLPALRETSLYSDGLIHLQSLPSMVTCRVLDPQPGELIVDLNCSPAGKMSYISQLSQNRARLIGFDRNIPKIEKAREHLERLRCKNYQLIAHDSRYAHLDYTLSADKVLVDPPCTGLGVMPRLSVDATMKDVKNLAAYQKQFLRSASAIIRKGGSVVYSVCTITSEECEEMVEFAENELGLVEAGVEPLIGRPRSDSGGMSQRFDPELDGVGYFIAKFVKS